MLCVLPTVPRLDLEIRRGASFGITVQIPGDVPLDAFEWRGQLRLRRTSPTFAAEFEVVLLPDRWLWIGLTSEQTSGLKLTRYVYDICAAVGAASQPVLRGSIVVYPNVTVCDMV